MASSTKRKAATKPRPADPQVITSPVLAKLDGVVHGFSTRVGGVSQTYGEDQLNVGYTETDSRKAVAENRKRFLSAIGGGAAPVINVRQIHSGLMHTITEENVAEWRGRERPLRGDGLVTNVRGAVLAVLVADCVPVLVADVRAGVVGAFHAGWRGTAKRIVERGVGLMRARFGCRPQDLRAAIGPCIQQCCYAVGDEVVEEFESQFLYARELFRKVENKDEVKRKYPLLFLTARAPGHSDLGPQTHLDLVEANRRQLLAAGLRRAHISAAEECTSCRTELLFSHRSEGGFTGRMMGAIGLAADLR